MAAGGETPDQIRTRIQTLLAANNDTTAPISQAVINRVGDIAGLAEAVARVELREGRRPEARLEDTGLQGFEATPEQMVWLIASEINGSNDLPVQDVQVQYLADDQQMVLPAALGMKPHEIPNAPDWVATNQTLNERFWRLSMLSYEQMKAIVGASTTGAIIRQVVGQLPIRPLADRIATNIPQWRDPAFWTGADGEPDPARHIVFGNLSAGCQFNCDFRDMGYFYRPDTTCTDTAWTTVHEVDISRLRSKLMPYSVDMIAALNMPAVSQYALGAYVRAYGVSMGVLPAKGSKCTPEYRFVLRQPEVAHLTSVQNAAHRISTRPHTLSANILAIFGLLHLNKDHTYRTGDANFTRIGKSYIETLRTMVFEDTLALMHQNDEIVLRTAPHPFGMAQTYFVARLMGHTETLAKPLSKRVDACPPPVQRVMIVQAAMDEWCTTPGGNALSLAFGNTRQLVAAEADKIKLSPPDYSDLHLLYGIEAKQVVDPQVMRLVNIVMPCIYGYIMVVHHQSAENRDGLGYALSLKNVERDMKGVAQIWQSAWEKHITHMESGDLVAFANQYVAHQVSMTGA